MERWLFLYKEPRKKIEKWAYLLRDNFGDYWQFSKFIPYVTAREPMKESYSLENCFKQRGKLETQKLVIGQVFFNKPQIRAVFENKNIFADFIVENTLENYVMADSLFLPLFGFKIENYPYQRTIG